MKTIRVTIFSPVNVQVYQNDKDHPVMYIDLNSGFKYRSNRIQARGEFYLIFEASGFAKKVRFCADGTDSIEYDMGAILKRSEIIQSYNRKEAVDYLVNNEPTWYTFKTLGVVGTVGDLRLIAGWLKQWMRKTVEDATINYLIACACEAMGKLEVRYGDGQYIGLLEEIYNTYRAKSSYGYIIEKALKTLHSYFRT